MTNMILIGLSALAAITGFSSDTAQYTMTEENYAHIASIIGGNYYEIGNDYYLTNATQVEEIYSIHGENRYFQVETRNGGYLIYDKMESFIVEYESSSISPFEAYNNTLKILYPTEEETYHIVYDNNSFYSVSSHSGAKNVSNMLSTASEASFEFDNVFIANKYPKSDAIVIPNKFYFENLNNMHGYNTKNICTIISAQIMLGYYDTFHNDNIVDGKYELGGGGRTSTKDLTKFTGQGTGNANVNSSESDQRFRDDLLALANQVIGKDPEEKGIYLSELVPIINEYLYQRKISHKLNYFTTTSDSFPKDAIKIENLINKSINAGRPVIVAGSRHAAVAYGYDNDYVYVHNGKGNYGAVPWKTFQEKHSDANYDTGVIDIQMTGGHVHSDNYYSAYYREHYCPCGKVFQENYIQPEDYDFEQAYYSDIIEKRITIDDLSFLTKRKRCGYIEKEYINLSSRRENVNEAYLEYHLDCTVKTIEVNISFWSANEVFLDGTSSARIDILDYSGEWVTVFDLLKDVTLSTDRNNQNKIIVEFPPNVKSFRFYASNLPIGDRNKGRISIGELRIIHD